MLMLLIKMLCMLSALFQILRKVINYQHKQMTRGQKTRLRTNIYRGFSGVHNIFVKPEIRLNLSPVNKIFLNPELRLKPSPVNTKFPDLKPRLR